MYHGKFFMRHFSFPDTVLVPTPNDEQKPVESASDVAQSSVRILRIDGFTPAMDKETVEMASGKKVVSRNGSVGTAASVTVTETEEQDPCDREEDVFTIRGSREDGKST